MKPVNVKVFVPLSACACSYSHFMDRVMAIILPYRSKVEFDVLNISSPEADKYELFQMAVVLENHPQSEKPIVVKDLNQLEDFLKIL